jgi:hypothetical protein
LNGALSKRFGERWFDNRSVLADEWAQERVTSENDRLRKLGREPTPGRIVAALDFGFWTSLFGRVYEQGPKRPPTQTFWPTLIPTVFPHHHGAITSRKMIGDRLEGLRDLRNRAAHHEPIWKGRESYSGVHVSIDADHAAILETIDWISTEAGELARAHDRFPGVVAAGAKSCRAVIEAHCDAKGYAHASNSEAVLSAANHPTETPKPPTPEIR